MWLQFCAILISSNFSLFIICFLPPLTPPYSLFHWWIFQNWMSFSSVSWLRFCIHVLHMTHLSTLPPSLSVAAFAKLLAQHPRECHPFSVPMDQALLKLSCPGEFHQGCEAESWINPSLQCVVVRAGSSPWSSACQRQGLHCSSSTSLPSSEVCAAAESRAALAGDSSGDRFYPPSPRWSISVCLAALCRGSWAACSECKDIPLSLLPTKTVLGLSGLILNGLGCENLSSWDGRLEGGV